MAATSGLKPVRSVLNCSNNSRRHSEVHPMPNAAAGVVEDGEPEIVLLLEFAVGIGNSLVGDRDERGAIGLDDVCGFRQSFQVALTIRAPDTSVEGKNDGPDAQ